MLNHFVNHTTDLSSSTDPSNTSVEMIDVHKELCEVYERKQIGQPVTLTGKNNLFPILFY